MKQKLLITEMLKALFGPDVLEVYSAHYGTALLNDIANGISFDEIENRMAWMKVLK